MYISMESKGNFLRLKYYYVIVVILIDEYNRLYKQKPLI